MLAKRIYIHIKYWFYIRNTKHIQIKVLRNFYENRKHVKQLRNTLNQQKSVITKNIRRKVYIHNVFLYRQTCNVTRMIRT